MYGVQYKIKLIVTVDGRDYINQRQYPDPGCNHIDNIPGTADYMGQAILKKILEPKKGLDLLETTFEVKNG